MLCRLTYALTEDGRTVHISEVERGLSCGCVCPACGDRLVARKGDEVGHHFAHISGEDCPNGFTSSLYCAFKRVIDELGYIKLPAYVRNRSIVDGGSGLHVIAPEAKVRVSRTEMLRKAGALNGIAVYCGEKPMLLRIVAEPSTGKRNIAAIKAAGLPLLEIDLSRDDELNNSIVRELLTRPADRVYWVYNKRAEESWDAMLAQCEKLKVEGDENAIYTFGCMIEKKRADGFKCYVRQSCAYCEFFFGLGGYGMERYLLCGRRNIIAELADLRLSISDRRKKYGIHIQFS